MSVSPDLLQSNPFESIRIAYRGKFWHKIDSAKFGENFRITKKYKNKVKIIRYNRINLF